ncbi:uncharacterized protein LOC131948637 isoform X2 [Physella acuta]|uniref:uncharacterized protein LOC131948637 isoform X2 n=1 Tax=Physella acuta TaxID=109671 RepID=UPI0027DE76AC|nr:uncharacterized protein LOC131948637 isoform X2 [Physella acuta]
MLQVQEDAAEHPYDSSYPITSRLTPNNIPEKDTFLEQRSPTQPEPNAEHWQQWRHASPNTPLDGDLDPRSGADDSGLPLYQSPGPNTATRQEFESTDDQAELRDLADLSELLKSDAGVDGPELQPSVPEEASHTKERPASGFLVTMETPTALCKYRWSQPRSSPGRDVRFYPSYAMSEPIVLTLDENANAFFSENIRLNCGDYHGNITVDGKSFPVEEFSVRSYTFEIDLFMKEDVEDELISKQPSSPQSQSLAKTPEPHDSKRPSTFEELVRHQLTDKFNDTENKPLRQSSPMTSKTDSSIVSDNAIVFGESTKVMDGESVLEKYTHSRASSATQDIYERPSSRVSVGAEVVDDVIPRPPSRSLSQSSGDISQAGKGGSSPGGLPVTENVDTVRRSRASSFGAGSLPNSTRSTPTQDLSNEPTQPRNIDRFSPTVSLKYDDVSATPKRTTPVIGSRPPDSPLSQQGRMTPTRNSSPVVTASPRNYSTLTTPQKEILTSQMNGTRGLENGDSSRPGSRPPSHPNSRISSRNQSVTSLTSEQELAQYIEGSSRSSSVERHLNHGVSSHPDESIMDPAIMRGAERSSSVPGYHPPQQFYTENRSITPDNRVRVPPPADVHSYRTALVTERMEDVLGRGSVTSSISTVSRGSSRSATPVNADAVSRQSNTDRLQELEASVTNLRKLLTNRETEVHSLMSQMADLKDINRSLKEELEHRVQRYTPVSSLHDSAEFKHLQAEKEILAKEVVTLREKLQHLSKGHDLTNGFTSSGITDYSPNNPLVLQRKIVDLEAQIRDMHEVTESTTGNLSRAEEKIKLLQEENRELKSRAITYGDFQREADQHALKVELRTLREDIRNLKERNYQLTEENMRLLEGRGTRVKAPEPETRDERRLSNSIKSDEGTSRHSVSSDYKRDYIIPPSSYKPAEKVSYQKNIEDLMTRDPLPSHHLSSEPDHRMGETRNKLLQQRNTLESSRIRSYSSERSSLASESGDYHRPNLSHVDRSKPDGAVSEKVYSDKYSKVSTYDRKPEESRDKATFDKGVSSYLDKHYAALKSRDSVDLKPREEFVHRPREDNYKLTSEDLRELETRAGTGRQQPTSAISSKDIFLSLQQRTKKWLKEVAFDQPDSDTTCYDSDSTEVLVSHKDDPIGNSAYKSDRPANSKTVKQNSTTPTPFSTDNNYISGNLDFSKYKSPSGHRNDDGGDDSDTATDILLAQDTSLRGSNHRRTSVGSDGSTTLSEAEDDSVLRRRSKSVDTKRYKDTSKGRQMSTLPRNGLSARSVTSLDTAGFRSVLPTPQVTQHNKGELTGKNVTSLLNNSLTQGLRPFAPRNIADIRIDDVVKFSRVGGKLTQGTVKYVGHLPGRSEAYLGVELDRDEGRHDGTFEGIRYFKCKPNKGVFVAFNKVVMAWAP